MDKPDLDTLLGQAREGDALREAEQQKRLAEKSDALATQAALRAGTIRGLVRSWLESMSAAGHPGIQVLQEEYWKAQGILRSKQMRAVREVPGWQVARQSIGYSSHTGDRYGTLFVTADGRLLFNTGSRVASEEFVPEAEYTISGEQVLFHGHPQVINDLPSGLARVAEENGVRWTPTAAVLPGGPRPGS